MVSLGIEYEDSSANDQSIEETKSLRDIELWFPGIPGHHLLLNEYPTLMADYYRPLCWVSFGGAGGEYLKSLTGMMAYGRGSIRHIEFSYDTNDVPAQIRKQNVYEIFKGQATTHFPIDGASGETIDAVEVRLEYVTSPSAYSYAKHGALTSLKVTQKSTKLSRIFSLLSRFPRIVGEIVLLVHLEMEKKLRSML